MKLPAGLEKGLAQFDRLSLRERALVTGASLIAVIMIWTIAVFDPMSKKQRSLTNELSSVQDAINSATQSISDLATSDPTTIALNKQKKLDAEIKVINEQLASRSGGLIEPERMVQVIHDVLTHQHGLTLISLQNKEVTSLIKPSADADKSSKPAEGETPPADPATAATTGDAVATEEGGGPYVHPVELVIEGQYLDVLAYLRALEALPWRFNWKVLELKTTRYPLNRVTIELSTLSMDREWIGV
jgi:MSHA biogenesis protein MshJ